MTSLYMATVSLSRRVFCSLWVTYDNILLATAAWCLAGTLFTPRDHLIHTSEHVHTAYGRRTHIPRPIVTLRPLQPVPAPAPDGTRRLGSRLTPAHRWVGAGVDLHTPAHAPDGVSDHGLARIVGFDEPGWLWWAGASPSSPGCTGVGRWGRLGPAPGAE